MRYPKVQNTLPLDIEHGLVGEREDCVRVF
jgi:hypothetical protein